LNQLEQLVAAAKPGDLAMHHEQFLPTEYNSWEVKHRLYFGHQKC
jgi:hypothetical protein